MKSKLFLLFLVLPFFMSAQDINMQNGSFSQCAGMFYDNGGITGNYTETAGTQVLTLCSNQTGQVAIVTFSLFQLSSGDHLKIYDGNSTSAPLIGDFSGSQNPGTITPTLANTSGCLTFEFIPDGFTASFPGWEAQISCGQPCQSIVINPPTVDPSEPLGTGFSVPIMGNISFDADVVFGTDGTGATYTWDFGDGSPVATGQSVNHTYTVLGFYTVILTVTDAQGCSKTYTFVVEVKFNAITIDKTNYSFSDLVEQVLVGSCAEISNITGLTGTAFGQSSGIAFFENNNSIFPMDSGVVMYTGDVLEVPGPESGIQSSGGWPGDADLLAIAQTIPGVNTSSTNDATLIEFDFVSFADHMSFNFLFASDEYGFYQCGFSDVFAFLLTDPSGNTQNLAVVPNTAIPVAVTTIRDSQWNSGCPSANVQYFDVYYGSGGANASYAPIDFLGNTVVMTAQANITPGVQYHIKLAIADANDGAFNAAIFLEGGSFDIGSIDFGPDITVANGTALCLGQPITLDTQLTPIAGVVITWYKDGVVIPGETGPTLALIQPGTYSVDFTYLTSCTITDEILIEYVPGPVFDQAPLNLANCNNPIFDLAQNTAIILGPQNPADFTITYHTSQIDADNDQNAIGNPNAYTISSTTTPPQQTIYIRMETSLATCVTTGSFTITNYSQPTANQPPNLIVCDLDGDPTTFPSFDLTQNDDDVLGTQDPLQYTLSHYTSMADATAGVPGTEISPANAFVPSASTTTIYVRIENNAIADCFSTTTFDLIINPLPAFNAPQPLQECDLGAPIGEAAFDLIDATPQIGGGNANLGITYYATQADADAGVPSTQLPTTGHNSMDATIFVRIEDLTTGCFDTATLDLQVIPSPTATAPAPYEVCDGADGSIDGQATFDLTTLDAIISGGAPNVAVTYHTTPAFATAGTPTVSTPTSFSSPSATIYARVTDTAGAGCYATAPVVLTMLDNPVIPSPIPDLEECDPEGDNIEIFDLTLNEAIIKTNEPAPGDWTVEYYASATDRNNGVPVPDETQFTNNPATTTQPIFVRVTSLNGCFTDVQFNVVVNPLPGVNTPQDLIICDDGTTPGFAQFDLADATTQITGNNPSLTVTYYEQQGDAQTATPGAEIGPLYTNTTPNAQTIYVRIEDNATGCVKVLPLDLQVNPAPVANTPQPYVFCDPDNDGFGIFDLTSLDNEITGGAAGVTVTYHETLANAQNDVLDIAAPTAFANTVQDMQTIYARVEAPGLGCFVVVNVVLQVVDSPQPVLAQNLLPLNGCDLDGDGIVIFDLTQMEAAILANEALPANFTLEYFASLADIPANPITVPTAFAFGPGTTTIYVVVTGPAPGNCTKQTSFVIIANPLPQITTPQPLELCDTNNPGDEQEVFDLTLATIDITMGDASIDVSYYQTEADALIGANPIPNPTAYTNQVNNETIYIRAVDTDTGCVTVQGYTLTLIVNPLPSPEIPADPVEVCDADNDGFAEFDLATLEPIIRNNEADVAITFHYTSSEAESGANPIDTSVPFGLSTANNQILYVRAENTVTGCYITGQIELEVVPTPTIGSLEDLYVCDDGDANGLASFDLTLNTANILGTQNPADVEITYHVSQADAEGDLNPIAVPSAYTNTSNGQTIYVRIENIATECFDTFDFADDNSFQLFVEELPVVLDPTPLAICDDDYGTNPVEQVVFDLTVKEGEITGQAFPPNDYTFTYYANQQDFQNGTAIADPTAYTNGSNPQEVYITVVNGDTENLCEDYTTLTLIVQPLPTPAQTDQDVLRLEECDDDNDGIAANPFDLTQSGNLIAGGAPVALTYWKTQAAAQTGDTNSPEYIATPNAYVNEPAYNTTNAQGMEVQVIYVNVESGFAGNDCFVVAQFEIMVVPAPVLNNIQPFGYVLCEDGTTGTGTVFQQDIAYNLYDASVASPDPAVLVPLLDQNQNADLNLDNYDIVYSADPSGTPPLASGQTVSTGDIIYVFVEYKDTGCVSGIGQIEITVEPRPAITPINITVRLCSDGPGGNTATIDLTQYDAQINPGAPANTEVIYYADLTAYNNGTPITDPSNYTTVDNPQTIIGVVRDTANLCESATYAEITIEVTPGPVVDISGYSGVLCFDLDPSTQVIGGDYTNTTIETGLDAALYTFEWTRNGNPLPENGNSLVVTEPGTYEVTVTDNVSGCQISSTAKFVPGNPPEFDVDPLTMAFDEEHALLISNVSGLGSYEFSVDNGPWEDLGADGTLTFEGLSAGTHFVYGRDKEGCGTTVVPINFIDYPKFFTPNGDGYNDVWNILGLGPDNASAKIYIFDRYGKLLKQLSPSGPGWDGSYNGNPMPADDYWFSVEYYQKMPDGSFVPRAFKANFSLLR